MRVEGDDVGAVAAAVPRNLHRRVTLAGHHVRRRHDEVARREPAASLHADATGGAENPHDGRRRAADTLPPRDRWVRRLGRRRRPGDRRERIDARKQVEQPTRRHSIVEAPNDLRALHFLAQRRLPRDQERRCTEHPHECQAACSAEDDSARRIEEAKRRQLQPAADHGAGERGDRLPEPRAGECADETHQWRPARARTAAQ